MEKKTYFRDHLNKALIHDLKGLLSPIFTICQSRVLFDPPNSEEAAKEYLLFHQASTQMNELLNSWSLAFCQENPGIPGSVDSLLSISAAGKLLSDMIPEESLPQVELPSELPSCIGHEHLFRQAFSDIFRFLAGLATSQSKIIVTGTITENQAIFSASIPGKRCSDKEIGDYLHYNEKPNRYVYALVGARFILEKQGGKLEIISNEPDGTFVRVKMPR